MRFGEVTNLRADNEFLIAMSNKLQEIADNTTDMETKRELDDLIEAIVESL
jgi:predicted house-cleaning noncanonical NTP pyrophosphatase (MazG superfamily)